MALQETTIVARYVNAPKPGGKFGNVKTPGDELYWAEAPILSRIQQGETVAVRWKPQTWGDRSVKVIDSVIAEPETSTAPSPAPAPRPNGASYTNGSNAEDIFVTGVVGRAMGSGKFETHDILPLVTAAAQAYQAWKSGAKTTVHEPPRRNPPARDLDDKIPF